MRGGIVASERLISGTVYDKRNGEVLIGADIMDVSTGKNVITNAQGRYSIWVSMPCESTSLKVSYISYSTQIRNIGCETDKADWHLESSSIDLNEVVVSENTRTAHTPELSVFSLKKSELDAMPAFGAEKDLLLYFQLRPGAQLAGDGNSNLYIRGGTSDQNLFLLDDVPLYHVSHLGGFNSAFNADIIKSADLYLGAFPAQYGGRLSSVLDIHTKDGDLYTHHQSLTLGMLTSKITVEGPFVKGKSSYVASFRLNTLPLFKLIFDMNTEFSMYDANVKLNYIVSPADRLYFSFYAGEDALKLKVEDESFTSNIKTSWGNVAGALRYNKIFSSGLFANFTGGFSQYHYNENNKLSLYESQNELSYSYVGNYTSSINDVFLKSTFDYFVSPAINAMAGYELCFHNYMPGRNRINQSGIDVENYNLTLGYPSGHSIEQAFFIELHADNFYGFSTNIGIRENLFHIDGKTFQHFQPRIILSRKISTAVAVKASYAHVWQVFHLLSSNGAGLPADYRIPAIKEAPPSKSEQITIGLNIIPPKNDYEFSLEAYIKSMNNLTDLKEGVTFTTTDFTHWEDILARNGNGNAKGIELLIRKVRGKSSGWIGAALAGSTRRFDDLNGGKVFAYKYDRWFNFSCLFQQKIGKQLSLNATWVFGTGLPYNLPQSQYKDMEGNIILIYGELNQFREKSYHRLDVGVNYEIRTHKLSHILSLSIINVYNRKNPYIYITQSGGLYEFSLFPVMPSLSYTLKI